MDRAEGVIRTPDQRLRVFVSSTLKELAPERRAVRAAIEQLALAPVMFELGARPHPPRELYRAYLEQSDIFIGVYAEQYGWIAPGETVSGLEDEWNLAPDIPKLIYLKQVEHRQPRLEELLARIREDDRASYVAFTDSDDLARLVTSDLATLLAERFDAADPARHAPMPDAAPPTAGPEPVGLPSPLTRLLGRDDELATVTRMLGPEAARLVTITGPGGIGKSRLAIAAARAVEGAFPDGTVFVDLAPVQDADRVVPAIAFALGIRDTGDVPLAEKLPRALADRRLLLVLDNVEQVVDAAPRLSALIAGSDVSVLATSRVLLRIAGEQAVDLGPLPRPAAEQIFRERARAVKRGLEETPENDAAISAIVAALDSSPLALELAAARVRVFTPAEILGRLDHALPLLVDGPRDVPDRQRTMRATIEWSARLLSGDQRELLLRLGVFRGGFALDAVEWMADGLRGDAGPVVVGDAGVIEALAALVDSSLVRQEVRHDRAWFTMLATVGEYARDRLEASGALADCAERHARFYVQLAAAAAEPLTRPGQGMWMARLADEADGLRDSVAHLLATRQWDDVLDLIWPLAPFWWASGRLGEIATWTGRLLEPDVVLTDRSRTIAVFVTSATASQQAPDPALLPLLEECVSRFAAEGDEFGEALALASLAMGRFMQPHPDLDAAETSIRRCIGLMDELGNPFWRVTAGLILGSIELLRGRIASARDVIEANLAVARSNDDRMSEAGALGSLGWARLLGGDVVGARECFAEAVLLSSALGSEHATAYGLEGLFAVAASTGDLETAGRFLGAAESIRERKGMLVAGMYSPHQQVLTRILDGPDAARFAEARTMGRTAELADVVELALAPSRQDAPATLG